MNFGEIVKSFDPSSFSNNLRTLLGALSKDTSKAFSGLTDQEINDKGERMRNPYGIEKISTLSNDGSIDLAIINSIIFHIGDTITDIDKFTGFPLNSLIDVDLIDYKEIVIITKDSTYKIVNQYNELKVDSDIITMIFSVEKDGEKLSNSSVGITQSTNGLVLKILSEELIEQNGDEIIEHDPSYLESTVITSIKFV